MAPTSRDPGNGGDTPSTDQPIPLQDFSRPLDGHHTENHGRSRVSSRGGGRLSRPSLRGGTSTDYARISEGASAGPSSAAGISRPNTNDRQSDDVSLVEDPGSFAMSTIGLSFDSPHLHTTSNSRDITASEWDSVPLDTYNTHETDNYLGLTESYEDTAPLADQRYLQPISGAAGSEGTQDERSSNAASERYTELRLGDDLPNLESGLGRRRRGSSSAADRARSLSPGSSSAIQRASSIVKSMSQRVVNVSNAPEVIEDSIREEESRKDSRMEGPPPLPAMSGYAHDTPSFTRADAQVLEEKRSSDRAWMDRNNPLKGKPLGILRADNPLRIRLCDILVHPFTEPFILVVIILQTVLLTVESARSVFDSPKSHWGSAPVDYIYLCIFIIYTLELIAKILVSGFIMNPVEYSTLNRSLGLKQAVAERGKNLITPQRHFSRKVSMAPAEPQASIIRTFTGLNQLELEVADDPLQTRRIRLAHRAFLRHSFNRLDFVAVVSFWVSFLLSLSGVETREQIYVFRMLSCLRILRLLALTNGTSVSCTVRRPRMAFTD